MGGGVLALPPKVALDMGFKPAWWDTLTEKKRKAQRAGALGQGRHTIEAEDQPVLALEDGSYRGGTVRRQ